MWVEGHLDGIMGEGQPAGIFGRESGLLDNLCNAIQILKHLKGTEKSGNYKRTYFIVTCIFRNEYDITDESSCYSVRYIVNMIPKHTIELL